MLSKVPAFREAQKGTAVPAFLAVVYLEWFQKWPVTVRGTSAGSGTSHDADASSDDSSSESSEPDDEFIAIRKSIMNVSALLRQSG